MEYETTVSLVFGATLYGKVFEMFRERSHVEEDLDVFTVTTANSLGRRLLPHKYRELKRYRRGSSGRVITRTLRDRKITHRCVESQVPHQDPATGRVIFVTATYKESREDSLTAEEWQSAVMCKEDHSSTSCLRTSNKRRLCFPPESFADLFDGEVPAFDRLSLGEYSIYSGTLEARTKCCPVYYMEIERESDRPADCTINVDDRKALLVAALFRILPYRLVAEAMLKESSSTVRLERVDVIFDEFKRRFLNFKRCRERLWELLSLTGGTDERPEEIGARVTEPRMLKRKKRRAPGPVVQRDGESDGPWSSSSLAMFVMPKWDGMKAIANYCEGFLFVKDACGKLSTFRVGLPFDNDLILQLEIVSDPVTGKRLMVVTEIMAVVVTNHGTLYHVYGRNNAVHDTGRFAGNVSTGITITRQFNDPDDICNTYRLVKPEHSLITVNRIGEYTRRRSRTSAASRFIADLSVDIKSNGKSGSSCTEHKMEGHVAVNNYQQTDVSSVIFTSVSVVRRKREIANVLVVLDRFHGFRKYGGVESTSPILVHDSPIADVDRTGCIDELLTYLPTESPYRSRFNDYTDGLLVAFVHKRGSETQTSRTLETQSHSFLLPDYGYFKIKPVDTVDLEYRPSLRLAVSSSGTHHFRLLDVPAEFPPGWAVRPSPVTNDRAIVECFYDRRRGGLVFMRDRPDKNRADSDEKISAIDSEIIIACTVKY